MHIVLLGDSIFDNGAYVRRGEPDVVRQLRDKLPAGAKATLAAVDGATTAGVARQLERLPADATHLVVSAGNPRASRCCSFACCTPPTRISAWRRASSADMPRWRFSSMARSR